MIQIKSLIERTRRSSVVFGALLLIVAGARAGDEQSPPRASGAESPKRKGADEHLAALGATYILGNTGRGYSCSLVIDKEGRFSLTDRRGLRENHGHGDARLRGGHLILTTDRATSSSVIRLMPTDFIPVRWGGRIYLVNVDQKKNFCNAVNMGAEPREQSDGQYYLRDGDWKTPVSGLPNVPKEWRSMVLKTPLRASIVEPLKDGRARVGAGTSDGIWIGMLLWVDNGDGVPVEVVAVDEKSCVIELTDPEVFDIELKAKMRVSSNLGFREKP